MLLLWLSESNVSNIPTVMQWTSGTVVKRPDYSRNALPLSSS